MLQTFIKERREAKGISQSELARLVGLSRQAVSLWESGSRIPSLDSLEAVANVLECAIGDLVRCDNS